MNIAPSWPRAFCFFLAVASIGGGCSSSGSSAGKGGSGGSMATGGTSGAAGAAGTGAAGTSGTGGTGGMAGSAGVAGSSGTGGMAGTGGAAGTGGTGGATGTGGSSGAYVYFVKQLNGTTTASLASGMISVSSTFGSSGNAFKYVAPNYYGTVSNGFISFPTPMTGDFSIAAQVNITTQNKANNACGVGLGMTTGWAGTDEYAYVLMRNSNNATNGYYVSAAGAVSAGAPNVPFTTGTPMALSFSRSGSNVTLSASLVGGTATTQTVATSALTDGTNNYGAGAVYPAISFNNVVATITNLVIKDATGATVFDSATGSLMTYVPAALAVSATTVNVNKGASTTVTATANAIGGAVSGVTAVAADPTIVGVTVTNGATNSTIQLDGLLSGVTNVTVTNMGDSNTATNTKTIQVAVADFTVTDGYGPITTAYPAPAATTAYTDGELSLTFDAPPTLNTGGTIRIYKSDGTQVDSIAFAGETNVYGTTTINVGSQLARVSGNTVYFAPHLGKLAYGTAYYVAIPKGAITGKLNTVTFDGLSNASTVATWNFTTRAAPTLSAASITVDGAQTSTANFRTIQGALGAIASLTTPTAVTINVAAGTYNELVHYTGPGGATTLVVTISGPAGNTRGAGCVQQFANGNGMNGSTATRPSFYFAGANLVLQNITLKNTAVRSVVSQAEALYFANGVGFTMAAGNSSFLSNQDTIQTSGRAWFYNCFIEGNVDFIWGTSDATLVEGSSMHFINDISGGGAANYNLFVARTGTTIAAGTNGTLGKGYVALNSTVSVDANVTAYFGRDAGGTGFYDQVALVNVMFTGAGTIGAGLWTVTTVPVSLGDSSYIGWKSAGCTGLNLATATTATGTSAVIASQATEYATRDQILNNVVTVTAGVPSGYQAAGAAWDVSALATAWGAP